MLKSFNIIKKLEIGLEILLEQKAIQNYRLDLKLSHKLNVYIVSDLLLSEDDLLQKIENSDSFKNCEIFYFFLKPGEEHSDEYSFIFNSDIRVNFGIRRTLDNLLDSNKNDVLAIHSAPIITFYSYKGGVGRTTSLALFARYYANLGKKVFVLDCDFEAPGLINFFGISQFDNPKNGIVEFINDKKFDNSTFLNEEYVYEVSSVYSGEGRIHLMPAGNIFSENNSNYLEGLARVDFNGPKYFLQELKEIIEEVNEKYSPDLILVDSRTGFNNIFGVLSQISHTVVGLAGDDHQNEPGLNMLIEQHLNEDRKINICLVLSILSYSIPRRVAAFKNKIENLLLDSEKNLPVFHFQRQPELELIGTDSENIQDIQFFTSDRSSFYFPFFDYLTNTLKPREQEFSPIAVLESNSDAEILSLTSDEIGNTTQRNNIPPTHDALKDKIISSFKENFPQQYAEYEEYDENFFRDKFFIRQCMQDLFLPEYKILLGGKGTGKTSFYKALQNKSFFDVLVTRAEKKHLKFSVTNIVSEQGQDGFISFSSHFSQLIENENNVRKLWIIYIWTSLARKFDLTSHDLYFPVRNDEETVEKFKTIINSTSDYARIELSLGDINNRLKQNDSRVIITFDQLDFVVKPTDWDRGISPLIRFAQSNTWDRIHPKLFLRRDLFNKLGNITNKNSLTNQTVNLEWSQEEMYAFLFKVIFACSKEDFIEFLRDVLPNNFLQQNIIRRLKKSNQYNQLPADANDLKPLVEAFFGQSSYNYTNAYDELYNNLKNADKTVSLRPFLDLIRLAIEEQERDHNAKRGNAILSVKYCDNKNVRAQAVDNYFNDLAKEAGNELIRHFVGDIRNNLVPKHLKCSSLEQNDFEELVECIRQRHEDLQKFSVTEFEEDLKLNGIIFVTYISGHRKKYSFAYLYKYYMDLVSPKTMSKLKRDEMPPSF